MSQSASRAETSGFLRACVCVCVNFSLCVRVREKESHPGWLSVIAAAHSNTAGRDEGERGAEESHRAE